MNQRDPRPCVLIVDDERGPRESLRMILEPAHRVLQCSRGAEALEVLRRERVDAVTLDLHMPGMKGQELLPTLRREFPDVEVIVITGCGSIESAAEAVRQGVCDYLQKPFDVVQVIAAVARAIARRTAKHRLASVPSEICGRTLGLLELLAETIETKDPSMRGHGRRVAFYCGIVAERMGLGDRERELVRISAFLHDLGKVGVPTDLLLRPGALEPRERRIVEEHPVIGARLLARLDLPGEIALALRHHHEWWDGGGYPDGISGDAILIAARIISVADAFDAMSCDRPYRRALPRAVAVAELRRYAGSQFDAWIARTFLACLDSGICDVDPLVVSAVVRGAVASPVAA